MRASIQPEGTWIPESELILRPDGSLYHLGIFPEDVGDKIIIVGDPERVPLISELLDKTNRKVSSREFVVHSGELHGKSITIVSSGIGVDNIDIVINELDAAVNIDLPTRTIKSAIKSLEIVRIGTSGSIQADIPVGSFVASSFAFGLDGVPWSYDGSQGLRNEQELIALLRKEITELQHQSGLYAVEASEELLSRVAFDMIQGITATQNGFYGPQGRSVRLSSKVEKMLNSYASVQFNNLRVTNFEMESSGIYALSSMLGHKALTVCAILANRATKEFHKSPSKSIETLIHTVLERI